MTPTNTKTDPQDAQAPAKTVTLTIPSRVVKIMRGCGTLILIAGLWQTYAWLRFYPWSGEKSFPASYQAASEEWFAKQNSETTDELRDRLNQARTSQEAMDALKKASERFQSLKAANQYGKQALESGGGCQHARGTTGIEGHRIITGYFWNCGPDDKYTIYNKTVPAKFRVEDLGTPGTFPKMEPATDEVHLTQEGDIVTTDGPFYVYSSSRTDHGVRLTPVK